MKVKGVLLYDMQEVNMNIAERYFYVLGRMQIRLDKLWWAIYRKYSLHERIYKKEIRQLEKSCKQIKKFAKQGIKDNLDKKLKVYLRGSDEPYYEYSGIIMWMNADARVNNLKEILAAAS